MPFWLQGFVPGFSFLQTPREKFLKLVVFVSKDLDILNVHCLLANTVKGVSPGSVFCWNKSKLLFSTSSVMARFQKEVRLGEHPV